MFFCGRIKKNISECCLSKFYAAFVTFFFKGHLHYVRSYGRGISYTVQFAPSIEFDASGCNKDEAEGKQEKRKRRRKARKGKNSGKTQQKEEGDEVSEEKKEDKALRLADAKFIWAFTEGQRVSNI